MIIDAMVGFINHIASNCPSSGPTYSRQAKCSAQIDAQFRMQHFPKLPLGHADGLEQAKFAPAVQVIHKQGICEADVAKNKQNCGNQIKRLYRLADNFTGKI